MSRDEASMWVFRALVLGFLMFIGWHVHLEREEAAAREERLTAGLYALADNVDALRAGVREIAEMEADILDDMIGQLSGMRQDTRDLVGAMRGILAAMAKSVGAGVGLEPTTFWL